MMKQLFFPVAILIAPVFVSPSLSQESGAPVSLKDRVSYAYGVVAARQLRERGIEINIDQFMEAFVAVSDGGDGRMTPDEIGKAFDENQIFLDAQLAEGEDKANLEAGKAFLSSNAGKEGVVVTPRGLQYLVLNQGDGPLPGLSDTVRVHYHGMLIDGTVFDSSVERGQPISFALTRVIPGWTEALQLMPVGSKYRLFIPYHLAYGSKPAGPLIKPYSALIFEVELLGIE